MRCVMLGLLLSASALGVVDVRADEITDVDEVIAKYIEAIGGKEKLDAVKSAKVSGKTMFGGGMEAAMTIEYKRPMKMRVETSLQGMTMVQAFDGDTGWHIQPFMGKTDPEKMSPEMLEQFKDEGEFEGPLVDYKKKGHKAELLGKEDFEGSEVYKIKLTKKSGNVEVYNIDAEYFIPIQMTAKRKFQGTEMEVKISFGDYKDVGGLLIAHSMQIGGAMGGISMTFDKIELNVAIADERFKMPEVKKKKPASDSDKDEPAKPKDK